MGKTKDLVSTGNKSTVDYGSEHIDLRAGLAGIRTNASMYLGSVDAFGLFKAVCELLDNAADEFHAGRNKVARLHIDTDGSYWVLDQGLGVPQGIKETKVHVNGKNIINKIPTMQAIFGELHTSGKYRSEAYKVSVGTHGIGSKGTNATSEFFDVVTFFKGSWYSVGFQKGELVSPVAKLKKAPVGPDGVALTKGTCIHFKPDPKIFSVKSFPPSMAVEWAEIMAYLNPGFGIVLSSAKGKKSFHSKRGPVEYVDMRIERLKCERLTPIMFEYTSDLADVAVAFTNAPGVELRGFTNGLSNKDGGTHVTSAVGALYDGLCNALTAAGKDKLVYTMTKAKKGEKSAKKPVFRSDDLKEGFVGLINAKLHKADFSSQDKGKLTDARMGKEYKDLATAAAAEFFTKNLKLAITLAERAGQMARLKFDFSKSKALVASLSAIKKKGMSIKYQPPNKSTKIEDREIFLVEGDSAGGSCKEARLPYQGVMPCRGKILNALKAKGDKALESEDVVNILAAIGFDPKASDPYEKLLAGKLIFLADPDPDGWHINTLFLTLFYKYLPEMFTRGMIYIVRSPEFYAIHDGKVYMGSGQSQLRATMDKAGVPKSATLHHIKGWGEIDPTLLRLLAMDPNTRTLIQIEPLTDADKEFEALMSDDVTARKKMLGLK